MFNLCLSASLLKEKIVKEARGCLSMFVDASVCGDYISR